MTCDHCEDLKTKFSDNKAENKCLQQAINRCKTRRNNNEKKESRLLRKYTLMIMKNETSNKPKVNRIDELNRMMNEFHPYDDDCGCDTCRYHKWSPDCSCKNCFHNYQPDCGCPGCEEQMDPPFLSDSDEE